MADDPQYDAFTDVDPLPKKADKASRRASRSLRRARALYEEAGWQPSGEAAFLLKEAEVLAMMDLADAIRGQSDEPGR